MTTRTALLITFSAIIFSFAFIVYYPQFVIKSYLSKNPSPSSPLDALYLNTFPLDSLSLLSSTSGEEQLHPQKKVIAFVSAQCPFSINYMDNLTRVKSDFRKGISFVTVFKNPTLTDTFINKYQTNLSLYTANGISLAKKIRQVPALLFVDEKNKIIATNIGAPASSEELKTMFQSFISHTDTTKRWHPMPIALRGGNCRH